MAYLRIAAFAGCGVLAAIALLPQTGWVFRNDLSTLGGTGASKSYYGCLDPSQWPKEHALAKAINARRDGSQDLIPLKDYCQAHPQDAGAWAHLLRLASLMSWPSPDDPQRISNTGVAISRKSREATMLLAISNGERLEPDNLYFSAMKIGLLQSQGRADEAQKALLEVSRKGNYDDHALEEKWRAYDAALASCGFRGVAMELNAYAAIIFPHINCMRLVAFVPAGKPELQMAALRIAHTIAQKTDIGFIVIAMRVIFDRVLIDRYVKGVQTDPKEVAEKVDALDKRLGGDEAREYLADFQKVDFTRIEELTKDATLEEFFYSQTAPPLYAELILVALLVLAPSAYLLSGFSRAKLWLFRRSDGLAERPTLWVFWSCIAVVSVGGLIVGLFFAHFPTMPFQFGVPRDPEGITGDMLVFASSVLLGISLIAIPRKGAKPAASIGVLLAVLPVMYLGHVVANLRQDQGLKRILENAPREVDLVRGDWGR